MSESQELALKQLRIGELRNALTLIIADVSGEVARSMPLYSDVLRMPMENRRSELRVAIRTVAANLLDQAKELT